MIENIDENKGF